MDEDSLRDVFGDLRDKCRRLDLEVQSVSEENIDGLDYLIMNVQLGNEPLQFIGSLSEDWGYVILRYPFNVVDNWAVDLRRKDGSEESSSESVDQDYLDDAEEELKNVDINWREVKYGLAERLVSENCSFNMEQGDEIPLKSFNVDKRIFFDQGIDLKEVDDAVETVIGRAGMGRLWLADCLGKTEEMFTGNHKDFEPDSSENNDLGYIR